MKPAILTKYFGPTKHRSARVKAFSEGGSISYLWDPAYDAQTNHHNAAYALAEKLGLLKDERGFDAFYLAGGTLPKPMTGSETGYCFVAEQQGDY